MRMHYHFFCPQGTPYYDEAPAPEGPVYDAGVPSTWSYEPNSEWSMHLPPEFDLPEQGWKVHVSATMESAGEVLAITAAYCIERNIAFKHLHTPRGLLLRNSKYGDRGSSGKFLTIFPADVTEFGTLLNELGELLAGFEGPYILSDLRWGDGPLYVRYGGFTMITGIGPGGREVPCLRNPDGTLVPDLRGPSFKVPEWVEPPEVLIPALEARSAGTLGDFPFRATQALHFSNGGGVYVATDTRDGSEVLLKEARPHAGLDESGEDAVARVENEAWALRELAGLPGIPHIIDFRRGHEHYFLVREYVKGSTLAALLYERNPLLTGNMDENAREDYARWAVGILNQVEHSLLQMHSRGIVFGDLHPNNIMVDEDDRVVFIDLETSRAQPEDFVQLMGAPGFRAPHGVIGTQVDLYALACTRLAVFLPLTIIAPWHSEKAQQLVDEIACTFDVPAAWLDDAATRLSAGSVSLPLLGPRTEALLSGDVAQGVRPSQRPWDQTRGAIVQSVLASATPERSDRLFPGDPAQFQSPSGGLTFAHGAAGVLWSLQQLGETPSQEHRDWLSNRIERTAGLGFSFADGLAGLAFACDAIHLKEHAKELYGALAQAPTPELDVSIARGAAGIGLTWLDRALRSGDPEGRDRACEVADEVASRMAEKTDGVRQQPGLWHGNAGAALFLLRAREVVGDDRHLPAALKFLQSDLATLGWNDGAAGPWQSHTGWSGGSAGLAVVLNEVKEFTDEPWVIAARDDLARAAAARSVGAAGVDEGAAGILLMLATLGASWDDPSVQAHLRTIDLLSLGGDDEVTFLGTELLRVSTDVVTGASGIALALDAVAGEGGHGGWPFGRTSPADVRTYSELELI